MTYEEVRPYLGRICSVRVRCGACRDMHEITGYVQSAKLLGDVEVRGHTFGVQDIKAIWMQSPPKRPRRSLSNLNLFGRPLQVGGRA